MAGLTPEEEDALKLFAHAMQESFPHRVGSMQLFGSKARGDATKFSDVDVLVILDNATWEDRRSVSRISSAVLLETGVDLSAKTFTPQQLAEMKRQRSMFWQTSEPDLRPIEP